MFFVGGFIRCGLIIFCFSFRIFFFLEGVGKFYVWKFMSDVRICWFDVNFFCIFVFCSVVICGSIFGRYNSVRKWV